MSLPRLSALSFQEYLSGVHLPRKKSSVGRTSSGGMRDCALRPPSLPACAEWALCRPALTLAYGLRLHALQQGSLKS